MLIWNHRSVSVCKSGCERKKLQTFRIPDFRKLIFNLLKWKKKKRNTTEHWTKSAMRKSWGIKSHIKHTRIFYAIYGTYTHIFWNNNNAYKSFVKWSARIRKKFFASILCCSASMSDHYLSALRQGTQSLSIHSVCVWVSAVSVPRLIKHQNHGGTQHRTTTKYRKNT